MEKLKEDIKADHEKLIKIDTKVTAICKSIEEIKDSMIVNHRENVEANAKILDRIDRNLDKVQASFTKKDDNCNACRSDLYTAIDKKQDMGTFKWVMGGMGALTLVACLTIGGFAIDNRINLKHLDSLMTDHIAFAAIVYEDVTGAEWGRAAREQLDAAKEKVLEVRKEALEKQKK